MKMLSVGIMPLLFLLIIGDGLLHRVPVFDAFIDGAKEGMRTAVRILPSLVGLIAAITMLRASGLLGFITRLITPLTGAIGIPAEVLPLALLRPVSGSGSLALVSDLFTAHGPDSMIGKIVSVMMGSTETTFYTLAVYFGSVGIKDSRFAVTAALSADVAAMLSSVWLCRLFFG